MIAKEYCNRIDPVDILDMLPGMVLVLDSEGNPVYMNETAESAMQNNIKNSNNADLSKSFLKGFIEGDKIIKGEMHTPFSSNDLRFMSNPFSINTRDGGHELATLLMATDPTAGKAIKAHCFSMVYSLLEQLRQSVAETKNAMRNIDDIMETRTELERIVNVADDMQRLIRIESGTLEREFAKKKSDVSEVLQRVIEGMSDSLTEKNITISGKGLAKPVMIEIHESLEIVFKVLLRNAITFSPTESEIEIKIEESNDEVSISFQDSGSGIPLENQNLIFTRGFSEKKPGVKMKSTGLGLYIAKHIVELHEGILWVESTPGKGSLFTVSLQRVNVEVNSDNN